MVKLNLKVTEVCELFGVGRHTAKKLLEIEKQFVKEQKKKKYLYFKKEERKQKQLFKKEENKSKTK